MKVAGDWLSAPGFQALCAALEARGFRALAVGGCVRNAILGQPVADVDISTDALPEIVSDIAEKAGFRVVPTGIEHGTVTVLAKGVPYEVTTFRRDVETDGRRAVVAFSTRIEEDAARRDLTMNALYVDAGGDLVDPLDGLPDLLARRVRFVGDADARIREDYLRILRFFRFHAWYADPGGGFDPEGLAACAANSAGTETLSRERIGAEVKKLLSAPDPAPALSTMARAGVLAHVLPGADPRDMAVLVDLEGDIPPRWLRRLAALGATDAADRLRLSRAEAADLDRLRNGITGTFAPAALGWMLGEDLGADAVLVRAALMESCPPPGWQGEVTRGAAARLPVTAADLMPALSGPALGRRLKEIEVRWLASDLRLTRDDLLA
ncbi:MAG: CCA tRNA nucleotidyltransferase [Paracoccaceae bacterium]